MGRNCRIWVLILLLGRIHLLNIFIVLDIIEIIGCPVLLEQVLVGYELCSLIRVGLNMTCIILDVAPDPILILDIKGGLVMSNPIIFIVLPILIIVVVGLLQISSWLIDVVLSLIATGMIFYLTFSFLATYWILLQYLLLVRDDFRLGHSLKIWILPAPSVINPVSKLVLVILRFAG